jgi:hypothetical protein
MTRSTLALALLGVIIAAGACAQRAGPTDAPPAANSAEPAPRDSRAATTPAPSPAPEPTGDTPPAPAQAAKPPSQPVMSPPSVPEGWREVFPHVRVDLAKRMVELDGIVPIDPHNPQTPRIYLEAMVCTNDTKEHESLVMTRARPSHVHAALLLVGITPGTPGDWDWTGDTIRPVAPTGPRVRAEAVVESPAGTRVEPLESWVINARDGRRLTVHDAGHHHVFGGSQFITRGNERHYRADSEGVIVGLATFGGETLGWTRPHHHDSGLNEPVWIADPAKLPKFGSLVRVRLTVVGD